jgi:hypothetical protein
MSARKLTALALVPALLFLAVALGLPGALAQAGAGTTPDADFTLERAVVGAGGLHATGASFELDATAGQPAAGSATGVNLGIVAGFWGVPPAGHHLYLPLVWR